jgi:hypothetical protein
MQVHGARRIATRLAPLLLLALLATSCRQLEPYFAFFQDWSYSFDDGGIQFASTGDLLSWVHQYVAYAPNSQMWGYTEYWASPEQTFGAKQGDCKAYALLFMYYAYSRHLAVGPELVAIENSSGPGHAIVRIGDTYYDPTNGTEESASSMNRPVWYTLNYGQAIYIATHDHDAWKGITGGKIVGSPAAAAVFSLPM